MGRRAKGRHQETIFSSRCLRSQPAEHLAAVGSTARSASSARRTLVSYEKTLSVHGRAQPTPCQQVAEEATQFVLPQGISHQPFCSRRRVRRDSQAAQKSKATEHKTSRSSTQSCLLLINSYMVHAKRSQQSQLSRKRLFVPTISRRLHEEPQRRQLKRLACCALLHVAKEKTVTSRWRTALDLILKTARIHACR